jgi:hypothetical protein
MPNRCQLMGGNAVIQGKHNRIPKKRGPIIAVARNRYGLPRGP